jgi:hypothetical protein
MKKFEIQFIIFILLLTSGMQVNAQLTHNQKALLEIKSDSLNVAGLRDLAEFVLKGDTLLYKSAFYTFSDSKAVLLDMHKRTTASSNATLREWEEGSSDTRLSMLHIFNSTFDKEFKYTVMNQASNEKTKKVKWGGQEYELTARAKAKFDLVNTYIAMETKNLTSDQEVYIKYKSKFN